MNVVFHVDQGASELATALTNITNYFAALPQQDYTVVLVVNGAAIQCMGADDPLAGQLTDLARRGLSVRVCQNALNHFNLTPQWLNPVCHIVPAGVVELVMLQRQGFAYIKP